MERENSLEFCLLQWSLCIRIQALMAAKSKNNYKTREGGIYGILLSRYFLHYRHLLFHFRFLKYLVSENSFISEFDSDWSYTGYSFHSSYYSFFIDFWRLAYDNINVKKYIFLGRFWKYFEKFKSLPSFQIALLKLSLT